MHDFASSEWGHEQKVAEHLSHAAGEVRWKVLQGQGGRCVEALLQHVLAARSRLAHRICVLGGDRVRQQWIAGVPDEVCDRVRLCWGDLQQPAAGGVGSLFKAKAKGCNDQLRPVGVVPTTQVGVLVRGRCFGGSDRDVSD